MLTFWKDYICSKRHRKRSANAKVQQISRLQRGLKKTIKGHFDIFWRAKLHCFEAQSATILSIP